jgi:hypothetical protein
MGFKLTTIADGRIAVAKSSGTIDAAERRRHRDETIKFCKENRIHNVIVDIREQTCHSSTMEIFDFGSTSAKAIRDLRVAFLPAPDDRDMVFLDAVVGNRGAVVRICRSMDEAREWLESLDAAPAPDEELKL